MAAVVLVALIVRRRAGLIPAFRNIGLPGLFGGMALGVSTMCFVWSITNTTVANTLFLIATAPLFTAVFAWLLLRERVNGPAWIAIAIASLGVSIMVHVGITDGRILGNVVGLGIPVNTALFVVAVRAGRRSDMLPTVCVAGIFGAIVSGAVAGDLAVSGRDLVLCALMGTAQVGLGMMLYTLGARHIRAAELSLLSMIEFIIGPIWVWLIVSEVPAIETVIGGVIILGSVSGLALWMIFATAGAWHTGPRAGSR